MRTLILALLASFVLAACGGGDDYDDTPAKSSGDPERCAPGQLNCK